MCDVKVVQERTPDGVLAEEGVRKTHDRAVDLGENRACPRVRDGKALGPQRQQVPGDVVVEEGIGEGPSVVPLPAAGVQCGDGMRVVRACRPGPQPGWDGDRRPPCRQVVS